eukprot:gb/GEZN01005505.1/.p1 GENE.gb/GEZN01005505.1/~~gb/GEZN01005505.1/.p1  ORF type:complete len:333 (-),score=109.31 gb/GEZN01005505.1/:160-1158(-)
MLFRKRTLFSRSCFFLLRNSRPLLLLLLLLLPLFLLFRSLLALLLFFLLPPPPPLLACSPLSVFAITPTLPILSSTITPTLPLLSSTMTSASRSSPTTTTTTTTITTTTTTTTAAAATATTTTTTTTTKPRHKRVAEPTEAEMLSQDETSMGIKKRKLSKKERKAQKLLNKIQQLGYQGVKLEIKPSEEDLQQKAKEDAEQKAKIEEEESYTKSLREARNLAAQWAQYPGMARPDQEFKAFEQRQGKETAVKKPFPQGPDTWFNSSEPPREPSKWKRKPPRPPCKDEKPEDPEAEGSENSWYKKKWGQTTGRDYGANMLLDDLYITNAGRGT